MPDVEPLSEVSEEILDIFDKYKQKQKFDLVRTLNHVRCCECGHKSRINSVQCKSPWYSKMSTFSQIALAMLAFVISFIIYGIWATRRYNRARLYGNGSCVSKFFWTYDECTVSF